MYTIQKKESEAINILRVIFTVMVVYIHSHVGAATILDQSQWVYGLEYVISESICRCAVPGFFLISAILLYRKPFLWKENLKKKIRGILIPYIVMNTFWILFFLITKKITVLSAFFNTSASDIYNWGIREWLNAYLGFDGLPVLGQTWFLRDLFVVNVLAVLLKKIIDKIPRLWIVIISLLWILNFEIPVFCISIRAVYFFSLGYYIVKYDIHVKEVKRIPSYILSIAYSDFSYNGYIYAYLHSKNVFHKFSWRHCTSSDDIARLAIAYKIGDIGKKHYWQFCVQRNIKI